MIKRRALLLAAVPLPSLAGPQTLAELLRAGDDDGAVRAVRRAVEYRHEYRRWPRPTADVLRSGWGNCTDMAWLLFGGAQEAGIDRRLVHCIVNGRTAPLETEKPLGSSFHDATVLPFKAET